MLKKDTQAQARLRCPVVGRFQKLLCLENYSREDILLSGGTLVVELEARDISVGFMR